MGWGKKGKVGRPQRQILPVERIEEKQLSHRVV